MIRPVTALFAARALRDFGDGFVAILLPAYLLALGHSPAEVGLIATLALLGSALLTLLVGLFGARHDLRRLLLLATGLMVATGLAMAAAEGYALLAVIAFSGTINPSSGSASVFMPLEQAALAREAADSERTGIFARYGLCGALAGAAGGLAAGAPELMQQAGLDRLGAIRLMFVLYALIGLAGGLCYLRIPRRPAPARHGAALGPSRAIVIRLAALFSLDSFAGGFVVQSLLALWLFQRFGLSAGAAGVFFFWAGLLSALSLPVAGWLGRRIGLVRTMVFTHLPSSVALILAALAPDLATALALLLLRAALSQMDVPTRSSYVMAVVTEAERTAAASFTAVPRSLAAAISPALSGALFAAAWFATPLVLCGGIKIAYDLLLLRSFRHLKPPEET